MSKTSVFVEKIKLYSIKPISMCVVGYSALNHPLLRQTRPVTEADDLGLVLRFDDLRFRAPRLESSPGSCWFHNQDHDPSVELNAASGNDVTRAFKKRGSAGSLIRLQE